MAQATTRDRKAAAPKSRLKKAPEATEPHKGLRYVGVGLYDGRWCVFRIEPDGAQTQVYRSPQLGEPGRPFAFSEAMAIMELDAGRQL